MHYSLGLRSKELSGLNSHKYLKPHIHISNDHTDR